MSFVVSMVDQNDEVVAWLWQEGDSWSWTPARWDARQFATRGEAQETVSVLRHPMSRLRLTDGLRAEVEAL